LKTARALAVNGSRSNVSYVERLIEQAFRWSITCISSGCIWD
jgi:hypothetical protein